MFVCGDNFLTNYRTYVYVCIYYAIINAMLFALILSVKYITHLRMSNIEDFHHSISNHGWKVSVLGINIINLLIVGIFLLELLLFCVLESSNFYIQPEPFKLYKYCIVHASAGQTVDGPAARIGCFEV
jgi:hypothetical protein